MSDFADTRRRLIIWGRTQQWPVRHRVYNLVGTLSELINDTDSEAAKEQMKLNAAELSRFSKDGPLQVRAMSPAEIAKAFGLGEGEGA